jgi:dethiobiotin synthetase
VAGIFVTGTGTDIGKTFIATALIRHLRNAGKAVAACKPVVSGFEPSHAAESDPGLLLSALGLDPTTEELDRISPWRFLAPMSPHLAARAEGRSIDFRSLVEFARSAAYGRTTMLVEGVGGIMVPLDSTHTVLDWMSALRIPVLLVAGSYLGAISHTLTALHVLAQRNLDIAGVVVSESAIPGASLDDTLATIAQFAVPIEVMGVPRLAPGTVLPQALLDRLEQLL